MRKIRMTATAILFALAFLSVAEAQGGATGGHLQYDAVSLKKGEYSFALPEVRNEKLDSKLMGREMPFRVILPMGYADAANAARRYPVIYLLHGLTGNNTNWTDLTKLTEHARTVNAIIVTPEGENGWYTNSLAKPDDRHESYIVKELIPEIDKRFRTEAQREKRAIAGLSMGGYGALKFGLKYPELFAVAGSFSGALSAAEMTEKTRPGAIGKSIDAIFGPENSDNRQANDIFDLVSKATPEKIKTLPYFYIDCGTEDFLFQTNRDFISLLIEKKIPHEYRQLPGTHNWQYWDKQVKEFFRVASQKLT